MRVTMKGDYGLRAMIDLAAHYGRGPVPSAEIAARQHVPEHFLDQLLITLRRAGLLKSQRGPQGGHMLARPPAQITILDVIRALEGKAAPMEPLPRLDSRQATAGLALREVWEQVEEYAVSLLAATTLEQLAERHQAPAEEKEAMYYI
jgi:Rrf2 family protein